MTAPPTPDCPLCGAPPRYLLGGGTQAFCGSDGCPVFTWDPTATRDQFLATAVEINLTPAPEAPPTGDDR